MKRSFVLAIAVIAGLVAVSSALFAQTEIARFSGNGMRNTEPFTAPDGWELHWNARGAIFQVYLYSASGEMLDVIANQDKPGEGSSYVAKGGTYYLEVNALGSWTVSVVKSTGRPSTSGTVDFSGTGARTTKPFTMKGPWTIAWDTTGEVFQIRG